MSIATSTAPGFGRKQVIFGFLLWTVLELLLVHVPAFFWQRATGDLVLAIALGTLLGVKWHVILDHNSYSPPII